MQIPETARLIIYRARTWKKYCLEIVLLRTGRTPRNKIFRCSFGYKDTLDIY